MTLKHRIVAVVAVVLFVLWMAVCVFQVWVSVRGLMQ